ncbi:MAG: hypothetical protein IIA49_16265 [Bacteroidetes bacterium]|nr:hypothetical protein [Bacteroidota bacterium]
MTKKKKKIPDKVQNWIDARKKYHRTHSQVQMARELSMNPKQDGSLANLQLRDYLLLNNHDGTPLWKLPLPEFIENCYYKRFKRNQPVFVISIEEEEAINHLRQHIERWIREINKHTILRSTLGIGIASKAVNSFEKILRNVLVIYLNYCGIDYESELQGDMDGKVIDKITMGQVVQCFIKMDKRLTVCCRSKSKSTQELLKNRRLIKPIQKNLHRIIDLRNILHHHLQQFAPDEQTFASNTLELLSLIQDLLDDTLFKNELLKVQEHKKSVFQKNNGLTYPNLPNPI